MSHSLRGKDENKRLCKRISPKARKENMDSEKKEFCNAKKVRKGEKYVQSRLDKEPKTMYKD